MTVKSAGKVALKLIFIVGAGLGLLHCVGNKPKPTEVLWHDTIPALDKWADLQLAQAKKDLWANIHPADTSPGVIVASPSRKDPDYFYYWVRDGALVMNVVVDDYEKTSNDDTKRHDFDLLTDYVAFSRKNQLTENPSTALNAQLGEPKFNVDGSPFTDSWGRPQNDGPALRIMTLTRFAWALLKADKKEFVYTALYGDANTVIKADADFVVKHWREPCFDLWEEVSGSHFYTKMVQRTALIKVSALAKALGDEEKSALYLKEAKLLDFSLRRHWDKKKGYIQATTDYHSGLNYKTSQLDTAVLLAAIHTDNEDGFFAPYDDRILATAAKIRERFKTLYKINAIEKDHDGEAMEPALGRYPEDKYTGLGDATPDSQGNPWILNTLALKEVISDAVSHWQSIQSVSITHVNLIFFKTFAPSVKVKEGEVIAASSERFPLLIKALNDAADRVLRRVRFHAVADGSLDEEWNRDTGLPQGAKKLTWSNAAFITALPMRK